MWLMAAKLDKVVKPGWAAKVLCIDYAELPRLDHPWTKRDVHELRQAKPEWLTDARRRYATARETQAATEAAELDAALVRLGYTAPDAGTVDQAIHYIDPAMTHLMCQTRCTEDDAERAAWRRWPTSMTAAEDNADDNGWWG